MRNRVLFTTFTVAIFILAALGIYFGAKVVDNKRVSLSRYYDTVSKNAQNSDEKLVFLIKSDALVPKSDKKIQIALLLLDKGESQKAETYLIFAPNEQGNVLLTEYYLLNKPENAQKYLDRVKDDQNKRELTAYYELLTGKSTKLTEISNPKTEIGKLLVALNTQDYSKIGTIPLFSKITQSIDLSKNQNAQSLALAVYFQSQNQPHMAILVLNTLETKVGELPVINSMLAESYFKLGDNSSITYIAKAIDSEPENPSLYIAGINYARHFSDSSKADFWSERLRDLQNLQK